MTFYESGFGDRLVDPANYPVEIVDFLKDERRALAEALVHADTLIEVGAMDGLSLEVLHTFPAVAYVGIEPALRYVRAGNQRLKRMGQDIRRRARFIHADATSLSGIGARIRGAPLVFFPFNSFGNIGDIKPVADVLASAGFSFAISSYMQTEHALEVRRRYYAACGYDELRFEQYTEGQRFMSREGFCSWAYSDEHLIRTFSECGVTVTFQRVGLDIQFVRGG